LIDAEIWKPAGVPGGEHYEVSSHGRVRRGDRIHKLTTSSHGYKVVRFRQPDRWKQWYVHRLVALTFIPNPLNAQVVNHRDRDRQNNRVTNLEWVTQYENVRHRHSSDVREALYQRFNVAIVELVGLRDAVFALGGGSSGATKNDSLSHAQKPEVDTEVSQ
jgi:hypothetical protein